MKQDIAIERLYIEKRSDGNSGVFTQEFIPQGTHILHLTGNIVKIPNKYSIQIDHQYHLDSTGGLQDFLNHCCNPNAAIDFHSLSLYALRAIKAFEEITFDYCTSEEACGNPFTCNCNSLDCYKTIRGFMYLNDRQKECIKDKLSPFLIKKYF